MRFNKCLGNVNTKDEVYKTTKVETKCVGHQEPTADTAKEFNAIDSEKVHRLNIWHQLQMGRAGLIHLARTAYLVRLIRGSSVA